MIEQLLDVAEMIAAFAGGAFGAALGPLPAFIFTGFMVIAGEAAVLVDPDAAAITNQIAFGPPFSPAISFAGGVAATAYAARKGYIDTDFDYHEAKNIAYALGTKPDVLAVGGAFGILGYWLVVASAELGMPYDPIAMGVVLSALFHRLILGYSIIGKVRGSGILDMTPFEREERRTATDGGQKQAHADGEAQAGTDATTTAAATQQARFSVEPWLPHQYHWSHVAMIGLVAGILGAYVGIASGSAFLGFGISAASLVFLNCGVEKVPVTHHITLPAATAGMAVYIPATGGIAESAPVAYDSAALLANTGLEVALIVGLVFGIICALFGEVFQRTFYAHGDTHVDPPAAAIVFGTFLVAVLYVAGVFPTTVWVPWF
ncbi:hypothetical protein C482_15041 [Natrialba chahannaoensis JCM 10990]|uniref:DUF7973 domain-containing protein n=1 Tax=Natrialba chahannaoensis JCM 10990 TaxID=1227492 RepID=M0AE67_9EURY|nr:hypothetical protein [Natrialba chahannaoensis]ELY96701.1 hypothetical protein C482_15041 [Natrialba chahannaoensis JCM 10990]